MQEWDLRNDHQIQECVRHSDTVFNLMGRNYNTKYVWPTYAQELHFP